MNNIKDSIINILKAEDIKRDIQELIKPIITIFYNEIYIYLWFISIIILFLSFITLANLFLLLRITSKTNLLQNV